MVIIGFSGKMGSGKNYICENIFVPLMQKYYPGEPYLIMAFADQLKVNVMHHYNLSYEEVFNNKSAGTRHLLQLEGTEHGRDKFGKDVWVQYMNVWVEIYKQRGIKHFLIPDVRFQNELDWIIQKGGVVIRIVAEDRNREYFKNKNIETNSIHVSEIELDNYNFQYIINNGIMVDNKILIENCENIYKLIRNIK